MTSDWKSEYKREFKDPSRSLLVSRPTSPSKASTSPTKAANNSSTETAATFLKQLLSPVDVVTNPDVAPFLSPTTIMTPTLGLSPIEVTKAVAFDTPKVEPTDTVKEKDVKLVAPGDNASTQTEALSKQKTSDILTSKTETSTKTIETKKAKPQTREYRPYVPLPKPSKIMASFGVGNTQPTVPPNLLKTFNARAPLAEVLVY
jgi:hypothetical protein